MIRVERSAAYQENKDKVCLDISVNCLAWLSWSSEAQDEMVTLLLNICVYCSLVVKEEICLITRVVKDLSFDFSSSVFLILIVWGWRMDISSPPLPCLQIFPLQIHTSTYVHGAVESTVLLYLLFLFEKKINLFARLYL